TLVQAAPFSFFVGSTTAGLAYYNANVKGAMSACTGCHSDFSDYVSLKTHLATPSLYEGGVSTDNQIYDKPRGIPSHGGGVRCSSGSVSPCSLFPSWWTAEFN